jgi:hypothetical protein
MRLHGNAALSWSGRRRLAERKEYGLIDNVIARRFE